MEHADHSFQYTDTQDTEGQSFWASISESFGCNEPYQPTQSMHTLAQILAESNGNHTQHFSEDIRLFSDFELSQLVGYTKRTQEDLQLLSVLGNLISKEGIAADTTVGDSEGKLTMDKYWAAIGKIAKNANGSLRFLAKLMKGKIRETTNDELRQIFIDTEDQIISIPTFRPGANYARLLAAAELNATPIDRETSSNDTETLSNDSEACFTSCKMQREDSDIDIIIVENPESWNNATDLVISESPEDWDKANFFAKFRG